MGLFFLNKFKSKEAKNLIGNFVSLSLLHAFNLILPLVTLPYVTRIFGVDKMGMIAFSSIIMVYVTTLVDYGFNYSSVRDISRNKQDLNFIRKVFSLVLCSKFFLLLVASTLLFLTVICVPYLHEYSLVIFCTFLIVPAQIISCEWLFQGLENMKLITILNFFSRMIFVILVFTYIYDESQYYLYPLFLSISFFVSGIASQIIIRKFFSIHLTHVKFSAVISNLKAGFPLFSTLIVPNLYNSLPLICLNSMHGNYASGIYDGGNRFISAGQKVVDVLSRVFYPFLARRADKHNLYRVINLVVSGFLSCIFFIFADLLVSLFLAPSFHDSVNIVRIMAISLFFLSLMNVYGTNYLVLNNYEKIYAKAVFINSTFGLTIGILLVYYFSYYGIALAITITRLTGWLTSYFLYRKMCKQNNDVCLQKI